MVPGSDGVDITVEPVQRRKELTKEDREAREKVRVRLEALG